jgi:general secretion pathway protein J
MIMPARQNGFTLLEIMIAVMITAIMATMAYSGLNSILDTSHHTQSRDERFSRIQLSMNYLVRDLRHILPRSSRDRYGESHPAIETPVDGSYLISFSRTGWSNPAKKQRSHLQRVAYAVENGELVRYHWNHIDQGPGEEPHRMVLLDKVDGLRFDFLDQKLDAIQEWPPIGSTEQESEAENLPAGIRYELTLSDWGVLTRTLALQQ